MIVRERKKTSLRGKESEDETGENHIRKGGFRGNSRRAKVRE